MSNYAKTGAEGITAKFQKQYVPESQMTPEWYIKNILQNL